MLACHYHVCVNKNADISIDASEFLGLINVVTPGLQSIVVYPHTNFMLGAYHKRINEFAY